MAKKMIEKQDKAPANTPRRPDTKTHGYVPPSIPEKQTRKPSTGSGEKKK